MSVAISIITPVYNIKDYLRECVFSILNQTFSDFEIILVDDGSTDGSDLLCDEISASDRRIKTIHKVNGGPQSACLVGIDNAEGQYICFVDGDDLIEASYLYDLYSSAKLTNADIVVSPSYNYTVSNKVLRESRIAPGIYHEKEIVNTIFPGLINSGGFLSRGIQSTRWGKLFVKSIIDKNREFYDASLYYGEDLNMIFPVFLDSCTIVINDDSKAGYYYRCNPNSIVNSYKNNLYEQTLKLHKNLLMCSIEKKVYDFRKQIYADHIAGIVYCYTNEMKSKEPWERVVKNLDLISKDELFKKSLTITSLTGYPLSKRIVIFIIKHWGKLERNVVARLIYTYIQKRK